MAIEGHGHFYSMYCILRFSLGTLSHTAFCIQMVLVLYVAYLDVILCVERYITVPTVVYESPVVLNTLSLGFSWTRHSGNMSRNPLSMCLQVVQCSLYVS